MLSYVNCEKYISYFTLRNLRNNFEITIEAYLGATICCQANRILARIVGDDERKGEEVESMGQS
jgi:hypothetical protein